MCNETKVNTNNGDVTSAEPKKVLPPQYVGWIEMPFGDYFINKGDALDHAYMRSAQLASLLSLMRGEGSDRFFGLNRGTQDSLMWMANQLANEVETMFDIVVADAQEGGA